MKVDHSTFGNVLVLIMHGNVACIRQEDLMMRFKTPFIEGLKNVVLDFRDVEYIDSTAIGALIELRGVVSQAGGELVFSSVQSSLRNIFSIIRFNSLFRFFDTSEAAVEDLQGVQK